MNLQASLKALRQQKSLVNRTQLKDEVEQLVAKTFDRKTLLLNIYENDKYGKWFVILTTAFDGWTDDARAAFDIFNGCEFYRLAELAEMAQA